MKESKTKRVLILGDIDNTYIRGFITRFLKPCGFVIDVKTDIDSPERRRKCKKIAKSLDIKLIEKHETVLIKKLTDLQRNKYIKPIATAIKGVIYSLYHFQSKRRGEYDFVHVHYLYYEGLRNAWRYKTSTNKMIASWWGSDLLRKDDENLEKCWRYLKDFDLVTTDSIDLEKAYFDRVVKNREHISSYKRLYLGSEVADSIDSQINQIDRVIKGQAVGHDKVVIAIGYNASKAQQHLKVIEALSNLDVEIKNRIILLFQMTYGMEDDTYPKEVVDQAELLGFETIQFDKYLSNDEVANIRVCTDIFINSQTTDAFCSTIKEYMFAETVLINASWLEYEELQEWSLKTWVFKDFSEIQGILESVIDDRNSELLENNRKVISEKFRWNECAKEWLAAYEEI